MSETMIDVGLLLQGLGVGVEMSLCVEIVGRDENGCVNSVKRVPVYRVSTIDEGRRLCRLIVDKATMDEAPEFRDHDMMRIAERLPQNT